MRVLVKILMIAMIFFIPLIVITGAFNIVFRMPDLYVYQFNSSNFSGQINSEMKSEELGDLISSYMFERAEDFTMRGNNGEELGIPLTAEEKKTVGHFRKVLNVSLGIFVVLTVLSAISYFMVFHLKRKDILCLIVKGMWIVYLAIAAIKVILLLITKTRILFYAFLFRPPFTEDGVLTLIFTKQLAIMSLLAIIAISAVLLILITWLTRKLTKPRRMFGR